MGGSLAVRRFGVRLLNWVSCVYPPLRGLLFLAGNPYMIFDVYITIISGRNKIPKNKRKSADASSIAYYTKVLFRACRESVGSVGKKLTFPKPIISFYGSFVFCLHSLHSLHSYTFSLSLSLFY